MNALHRYTRREVLIVSTAATAMFAAQSSSSAVETPRATGLGFSLYGMKSLSVAEALKTCAAIGYDCVELPVMVDWPADSRQLSAAARQTLRDQLVRSGLRLTALMENLPALGSDEQHTANLERLKLATQLARDMSPADAEPPQSPILETIVGGKPGEYDAVKGKLVDRLKDWAKVLADAQVVLAIKAHIGNALQRPEQLIEVLDAVASPWLKAAYDYSHFQLQELELGQTMDALLPRSVFIHVKDSQRTGKQWRFVLPGEGSIDYRQYFQRLAASNYRGDAVVEVSGQVFNQPGYDPVAAARKCYNHLAPAMEQAGIQRG